MTEKSQQQDGHISVSDFVRDVRRQAEASAEASIESEDVASDPNCCEPCCQEWPEEEFWFGSYRSSLCKDCVARIIEDEANKENLETVSSATKTTVSRTNPTLTGKKRLAKHDELSWTRAFRKDLEQVTNQLESAWEQFLQGQKDVFVPEVSAKAVEGSSSLPSRTEIEDLMFLLDSKELLDENDQLRRDNKELLEENKESGEHNEALRKHGIELHDLADRLQKGVDRLKKDNEKRRDTIVTQGNVIETLKRDKASLTQLNVSIRDELEAVRQDGSTLKNATLLLESECAKVLEQHNEFMRSTVKHEASAKLVTELFKKKARVAPEMVLAELGQVKDMVEAAQVSREESGTAKLREELDREIAEHEKFKEVFHAGMIYADGVHKELKRERAEHGQLKEVFNAHKIAMEVADAEGVRKELEVERAEHDQLKKTLKTLSGV